MARPVLDHLQDVRGLIGAEGSQEKVVDYQDVDAGPGGGEALEPPVEAGEASSSSMRLARR